MGDILSVVEIRGSSPFEVVDYFQTTGTFSYGQARSSPEATERAPEGRAARDGPSIDRSRW